MSSIMVKRDYRLTNALGAKSVLKNVIIAQFPLKENDLLLNVKLLVI